MTEYVFRYAHGFGWKPGEYEHTTNIDHFGTLHEEIVRCRDCEYFDTRKCKSQWPFCLDAFCWWGKRKEGGE